METNFPDFHIVCEIDGKITKFDDVRFQFSMPYSVRFNLINYNDFGVILNAFEWNILI